MAEQRVERSLCLFRSAHKHEGAIGIPIPCCQTLDEEPQAPKPAACDDMGANDDIY